MSNTTSINKIELRGNVGQEPRVSVVGENSVIKFSVATNEVYKDKSGNLTEETTWHYVSAWQGKDIAQFSTIHKGTCVHVIGKIRSGKYTDKSGEEKSFYEVLASSVTVE